MKLAAIQVVHMWIWVTLMVDTRANMDLGILCSTGRSDTNLMESQREEAELTWEQ